MRSEKQIAASRQNGRQSNGAVTAEGKARIVAANLKSGIFAKYEVLPWESAAGLEQLKTEYYDHHQPASPEARLLLDELITCEWTLRRLRFADADLCRTTSEMPDGFSSAQAILNCDQHFARLQSRINSTRAAYHRTLTALQKLESADPPPAGPGPEVAVETPAPGAESEAPRPLTPDPRPPRLSTETPDPPSSQPLANLTHVPASDKCRSLL